MIKLAPPVLAVATMLGAASLATASGEVTFHDPVRIMAGGEFVKVERPGFAFPAWVDLNDDGHGDLVVGQFNKGKMKVYHGTETGFATGEWLMAGGKVAEVPGVW